MPLRTAKGIAGGKGTERVERLTTGTTTQLTAASGGADKYYYDLTLSQAVDPDYAYCLVQNIVAGVSGVVATDSDAFLNHAAGFCIIQDANTIRLHTDHATALDGETIAFKIYEPPKSLYLEPIRQGFMRYSHNNNVTNQMNTFNFALASTLSDYTKAVVSTSAFGANLLAQGGGSRCSGALWKDQPPDSGSINLLWRETNNGQTDYALLHYMIESFKEVPL